MEQLKNNELASRQRPRLMEHARKIRAVMATAAATAALAVPVAVARAEAATSAPGRVPGSSIEAPSSASNDTGHDKPPVEEGDALAPPPAPATKTPPPSGGVNAAARGCPKPKKPKPPK